MVEETRPTRAQRARRRELDETIPIAAEPAEAPKLWQRIRPFLLWSLIFLCLLALGIGVGAYEGRYQGERDRELRRLELADQHYRAGLARLDAGEYELAIAEFEYALKLNPKHLTASQGIAEARARMAVIPTPTVEVYTIVLDDLYRQARVYYDNGDWERAASVLTQLRVLDPDYATQEVEEMLFTSFYRAGLKCLEEDRVEEGIFYLDQAEQLRPLDEAATLQRDLAVQYMTALGYWGVDWELCIEHFEQLYARAPSYKDVFNRLYEAHVQYADAWYNMGEMCPAELEYARALRLKDDLDVELKRADANRICLVATPTPIAPLSGTLTMTLTTLPAGFTGRLAYPVYNTQTGLYDIYTLFADGRLMRAASGGDQPCWLWGSGALGYRNLLVPGIALLSPETGSSRQLTTGSGDTWPTFSPDGTRMAYAAQDASGTWWVYTAPLDGSSEPRLVANGRRPAWGPTGLLAWTGCGADGNCGIFVDNPDDEQPPARLSASINDIAVSWAPDGGSLAYMSNHTGDWEVYLVSLSGVFARLTNAPESEDGLPAWAPNGSAIAFVSNREGSWSIYLVDPNGENPRKIITLGPSLPDWTNQRISWTY